MSALRTHPFEVSGAGQFPFDMLRYDSCWPRRQTDVLDMTSARAGQRTVSLLGLSAPTVARWESFGWTVMP